MLVVFYCKLSYVGSFIIQSIQGFYILINRSLYLKIVFFNNKYCNGFVNTLNYLEGIDNNNFCLFKLLILFATLHKFQGYENVNTFFYYSKFCDG